MQRPRLVGGLECAAHLDADPQHVLPRQRPRCPHALGERAHLQELHGEEQVAVGGEAGVVDDDDVRMPGQGPDGAALPLEALTGVRVRRREVEHLDRHLAVEPDLPGPVDGGEAPPADLAEALVALDPDAPGRALCAHRPLATSPEPTRERERDPTRA